MDEVDNSQFSVINKIESKSESKIESEKEIDVSAALIKGKSVGSSFLAGQEAGWPAYSAILITGIAKPKPLADYLQNHFKEIIHLDFKDHHNFTTGDLTTARKKFDNIANHKKIIITTEKDWMRIQNGKLKIVLNDLPVYIQPITFEFGSSEKQQFNNHILDYVRNNKTNS